MAELPSSWGLTTRPDAKGKVEIFGKDDAGHEYKVRSCDNSIVTDRDVMEIAAADRERATAASFVHDLVEDGNRRRISQERQFEDECLEAAGPVVHAGLERRGSTVGYSRRYAEAYERAFNIGG